MTYYNAKAGQKVYYERRHWEPRIECEFVRYYRLGTDLVNPNCAVVILEGLHTNVDSVRLFAKQKKEQS
jgi:hypothetical protein